MGTEEKPYYRTSFDIPTRYRDQLNNLAYGERKQLIEKLLGLAFDKSVTPESKRVSAILNDKVRLRVIGE